MVWSSDEPINWIEYDSCRNVVERETHNFGCCDSQMYFCLKLVLSYSLSSLNLNIETSYLLACYIVWKITCLLKFIINYTQYILAMLLKLFSSSRCILFWVSLFVWVIRTILICRYYLPTSLARWCSRLINTYMWVLFLKNPNLYAF